MASEFRELLNEMDPDRRARIQARTDELLAALPLSDLRKARKLSQEELGALLEVNQATVSKIERRADMYVSTMRRFVEAMGGELEIRARFPDGVVEIVQFGAIPSSEGERKAGRDTSRKRKRRPRTK